jgi:hypothetical protein
VKQLHCCHLFMLLLWIEVDKDLLEKIIIFFIC